MGKEFKCQEKARCIDRGEHICTGPGPMVGVVWEKTNSHSLVTPKGVGGFDARRGHRNGSFKVAGALNLKLKKKPAKPARKGVNPFTKEPCVFKAKPASKTVRALPMKKLKEMVN